MGHHITAIVASVAPDPGFENIYHLPIIELPQGFTLVGLGVHHYDHWEEVLPSERLAAFKGPPSEIILDDALTHFWARAIFGRRYALIETDYHGGMGEQRAILYDDLKVEMRPDSGTPINDVLRALGCRRDGRDEFETLGLDRHRDFEDHFDAAGY